VFDLILYKQNEAFIRFTCEKSVAQELADYFTFFVPGYQFMPAYKNRLWDGKIRLADLRTYTIYHGLVPYIEKFCEERGYKLEVDAAVNNTESFSALEANEFLEQLHLDKTIITEGVREYQYKAFITAADFKSYGYDADTYCHRQYSGKEKHTDKFLTITTWQSIYKNPPEYFEQFDFVLGDEAHQFKAKSLTTIMTGLKNASYRIGCTGTVDGTQTHKLVLEGLFGPVYQSTTTAKLIENKQLADFRIKCLVLKYSEEVCKLSRGWDYQSEIDYIVRSTARNEFIRNLALSLEGNSLILFNLVEKHGKHLHKMIEEKATNRHVFFVYGGTDVDVREQVRAITEKQNNAIIVASYGTFSTGINIRNLHNVIFASPSKSRVRNLQSIGRGLRIGDNKSEAVLYDIADDFRIGKHVNYTLQHLQERVRIYDEEKFKYKFYNIEVKNA